MFPLFHRGVILFAMVCGRLPFNDNSLHSLIVQTKGKLAFPPRTMCSPGKEMTNINLIK